MHKKLIIANFKAELETGAVQNWLDTFSASYNKIHPAGKMVILCPSFIHVPLFKKYLDDCKLPIFLGAQDVSRFDHGMYTGEVTASALMGLVQYVLIGHSERRHHNFETPFTIQEKINMAHRYHLMPIVCALVGESYTGGIFATAYEPESAIGSGVAEPADTSFETMRAIHQLVPSPHTIYGGSVNAQNVHQFTGVGFHGVLVGKKSLDPHQLLDIIRNA